MEMTIERLNIIKKHYKRLEPYYSSGFGYLCGHNGWYIWDNNIPRLSQYKDFLGRLNLRNFTLFQTFNRYDLTSEIFYNIPTYPTNDPKQPIKANQGSLASNDVKEHMITIDIDTKPGIEMKDNINVTEDVITFLRVWFKDIYHVICTSGNGLYVYFPASSMVVDGVSLQDREAIIGSWSKYMEKLQLHLYKKVPKAQKLFKVDNIFNSNRQVKAPGSIHKKNGYIVLPIIDEIPFKYIEDLTENDYKKLEAVITFLHQDSKENTELKDILESNGYIEETRKQIEERQNYTPGTFGTFDDEISFDIINKCPLLFRLFSHDFKETKSTHRAAIMARYLVNLGYSDKRIQEILNGYPQFTDSMKADAQRFNYHGQTQEVMPAPNYITITQQNKPLPGLGAKDDYGNIRAPEGYKNPIQFIRDIIQEENKLLQHIDEIIPQNNTEIVRAKIGEISERIIQSNNKSINIAPPRAGKTHSTIRELLKQKRGSLIFGESHEQLDEMGNKFPQLYHWKGKQLLCFKKDIYENHFKLGINPCKSCGEDAETCEWKYQWNHVKYQPHILINKANIFNGVAQNLLEQELEDGTKRYHIVYDENLHEIDATYYEPITNDNMVLLKKSLECISKYIPTTITHIQDDPRELDKTTLEIINRELTSDTYILDIFIQDNKYNIELEALLYQYLENIGVLIINKEKGIKTEGEPKIFVERCLLDIIQPTILLDATPSPNIDITSYNEYDIDIPKINTLIIRPTRGDQTLTYAKDTAKEHTRRKENIYINWIQDQIQMIQDAGLTVGLISYKDIQYGASEPMKIETLFPDIDTLYYGKVRGMSTLDNKDVLIILGTWKPLTEAIYPEYRYRGGTKSFNEINTLYNNNEYERSKDGIKRRITGDKLFDSISLHITTSEMEQAILRNMGHLRTKLIICISAVPEGLNYIEQVKFNWNARNQINWSSIYKKYSSTLYDKPQKQSSITEQLMISTSMGHKEQNESRDVKRALTKANKKEILKDIWQRKEKGEKWIDIYNSLVDPKWKTYKSMQSSVTRWANKNIC